MCFFKKKKKTQNGGASMLKNYALIGCLDVAMVFAPCMHIAPCVVQWLRFSTAKLLSGEGHTSLCPAREFG